MNYTNVAVVAMAEEYNKPIVASSDWDNLIQLLDEYFGPEGQRLGWYVSNAKYPDAYVGYFEYKEFDGEIIKVKIYEVDFK
jgi:hypothetical protein